MLLSSAFLPVSLLVAPWSSSTITTNAWCGPRVIMVAQAIRHLSLVSTGRIVQVGFVLWAVINKWLKIRQVSPSTVLTSIMRCWRLIYVAQKMGDKWRGLRLTKMALFPSWTKKAPPPVAPWTIILRWVASAVLSTLSLRRARPWLPSQNKPLLRHPSPANPELPRRQRSCHRLKCLRKTRLLS